MSSELWLVAVPWALAWAFTPAVGRFARRHGWVDLPNARKAHAVPTPLLGGVALFGAAALGVLACAPFVPIVGTLARSFGPLARLAVLLAAVVALGLVDDRYDLRASTKLMGQVVIAVAAWLLGFQIGKVELPFGWATAGGPLLSLLLTVGWIVVLTNAFNFIDGMDGLATSLALVTMITLFLLAVDQSESTTRLASLALGGALAGFLRYNLPPARIFLGDAGSMAIGFLIAALSILSFQKSSTAMVVAVPLLVAGVPVLDTLLAVTRRLGVHLRSQGASGLRPGQILRAVLRADRGHIHHLMLRSGIAPDRILLWLSGAALGLAALAVAIRELDSTIRWAIVAVILLVGTLAAPELERRVERREEARRPGEAGPDALTRPTEHRSAG